MFILGIICGLALAYAPAILKVHNGLATIRGHKDWFNTLSFLCIAASTYVEQNLRGSLRFDPKRRTFVLSYFLKGQLHQLLVLPKKGPSDATASPLERGYGSLVFANIKDKEIKCDKI